MVEIPLWRKKLDEMFTNCEFDDRAKAYITELITELYEAPEKVDPARIATAMVWRYRHPSRADISDSIVVDDQHGQWEGAKFTPSGDTAKRWSQEKVPNPFRMVTSYTRVSDSDTYLHEENDVGIRQAYEPSIQVGDATSLASGIYAGNAFDTAIDFLFYGRGKFRQQPLSIAFTKADLRFANDPQVETLATLAARYLDVETFERVMRNGGQACFGSYSISSKDERVQRHREDVARNPETIIVPDAAIQPYAFQHEFANCEYGSGLSISDSVGGLDSVFKYELLEHLAQEGRQDVKAVKDNITTYRSSIYSEHFDPMVDTYLAREDWKYKPSERLFAGLKTWCRAENTQEASSWLKYLPEISIEKQNQRLAKLLTHRDRFTEAQYAELITIRDKRVADLQTQISEAERQIDILQGGEPLKKPEATPPMQSTEPPPQVRQNPNAIVGVECFRLIGGQHAPQARIAGGRK